MKLWEIGKLLHGGDYNVDQWLDRPDILAEDMETNRAARISRSFTIVFFIGVASFQGNKPILV